MTTTCLFFVLTLFCIGGYTQSLCDDSDIKTYITVVEGTVLDKIWLGENNENILVITTEKLYLSTDKGDTFNVVDLQGQKPTSIAVSAKKTHIALASDTNLFLSVDAGLTFTLYPDAPLRFRNFRAHPDQNSWLLGLGLRPSCNTGGDCAFDLYLSTDFGISWGAIRTYVEGYNWHQTSENDNTIVVWEHQSKEGNQFVDRTHLVISISHDFYSTSTIVDREVAGFLVTKEHIFYAKRETDGLNLWASDDGGTNNYLVDIPLDLAQKRYTILDTSEGFTFISIEHEDPSWGYVYASNGFNRQFSVALRNNPRLRNGRADFAELRNLEGIYFANQYELGEVNEQGLQEILGRYSVITYDKGGMWNRIAAPADAQCTEDCYLNLHGRTNSDWGQWYSRENAVGLIIGTGSVGKYLSTQEEDIATYISRDAGWTWNFVVQGDYNYEIANGGALILLLKDRVATNQLLYTWNEGLSVNECQFSDESLEILDIESDPLLETTRFLVTALRGNEVVLVSLDFDGLHERKCSGYDNPDTTGSDYEKWEPSDSRGDMCLLGRRTAYIRRKRESECLNPAAFITTIESEFIQNCSCTEENYECDYCHIRDDAGACVLDTETCPDFDPTKPPVPCEGHWYQTQGYRRVPGDTCDHKTGIDHVETQELCEGEVTEIVIHVNNDLLAKVIIFGLPSFGVLVLILSMLYFCSGKNEKVRGCLSICIPTSVLPPPDFRPLVPWDDLSDDLQGDASTITFSSTGSTDLEI